jgi:hypothetical protein
LIFHVHVRDPFGIRASARGCWRRPLALVLFGGLTAGLVAAPQYPTFALTALQADFDQFRNIVNTQQPRYYADRGELETAWGVQRGLLREGMDELQFLRVLAPLTRRLNCGHTSIRLSATTENGTHADRRLLPVAVRFRRDSLYVGKTPPGVTVPLGAEIVSINGRTAAEILTALYDNIPSDGQNLTLKQEAISRSFSSLYERYLDTAERFRLAYLDPLSGAPGLAELGGVAPAVVEELGDAAPSPDNGIGAYAFEADHAYLAIRSFNFYDQAGHTRFNAFVDEFFTAAAARGNTVLILDLRGNGGGDPYCGSYLFSHLIRTAQPYFAAATPFYPELTRPIAPAPDAFAGRMYFLINGGCFSTTGHFCSLLRYHALGEFVGEETGGSFTCTAANQSATLSRTGLRFSYSTQAFSTAVAGLTPGRGIMPDVEVRPSIEDYLTRRDPVLEAAVGRFRRAAPPTITVEPVGHVVALGSTVVLQVGATGTSVSYQWRHDGTVLTGATRATLVLPACGTAAAGDYAVTVSNSAGSVTSRSAAISVSGARASRLVNVSVRTVTRAGDQVLTVGFVTDVRAGAGRSELLLRALGPRLAVLDVSDVLSDPRLELIPIGGGGVVASNDNWSGDPEIRRLGAEVGAFPLVEPGSRDAAMRASLTGGAWTMRVSGVGDTSGTALAEAYAVGAETALCNVSARALVNDGNPLVAGFVISGPTARTVLLRGLGPHLRQYFRDGALADPKIRLYRHRLGADAVLAGGNDDWSGDLQLAAIARDVGAQPIGDAAAGDTAFVVMLEPGVYSAQVTGAPGAAGIALVEVYALP